MNLGRLGFMTTCSVQELPLLAYALQEGSFLTDEDVYKRQVLHTDNRHCNISHLTLL